MVGGESFFLTKDGLGVRFKVHLTPRAARNELAGVHGDALKIRLKAPPVEGRANAALVKFVAAALGLPQGAVEIVGGWSSRSKTVRVEGLGPDEVAARLADC
ncbi:MAG: DUF167 domain-containing protein [Thermodesulfobacteriota bacterium]